VIDKSEYIGKILTLIEPIKNGEGKARINDSIWIVEGPDCELGTQVKVISIKKTGFQVEPVKENPIFSFLFSATLILYKVVGIITIIGICIIFTFARVGLNIF